MRDSPDLDRKVIQGALNLLRRRWLFVGAVVVLAVTAAMTHHILAPRFVAQSALIVRTDDNSPLLRVFGNLSGTSGAATQSFGFGGASDAQQKIQLLRSNSFFDFVESEVVRQIANKTLPEKLLMQPNPKANGIAEEAAIGKILSNYSMDISRDLILIKGFYRDKASAEAIARWITDAAQRYLIEYELKELLESEVYLLDEAKRSKERIVSLIQRIDKYREDPQFAGLNADTIIEGSIAKVKEELEMVRVRIGQIRNYTKDLKSKVEKEQEALSATGVPDYSMASRGRAWDTIKDLNSEKSLLLAKARSLKTRLRALISSMRPQRDQEIQELKRNLEAEHGTQEALQSQLFSIRIYKISVENKVRVFNKVKPNSSVRDVGLVKKIGLAGVFAIFMSLVAIYMWEFLHPMMSVRQDFLRAGVRFLGSVPLLFAGLSRVQGGKSRSVFSRLNTIFRSGVRTPESTAVQFLGVRLIHNLERVVKKKKAVVSVLSAMPGEGKTLVSNSLAVSMGLFNSKVLVVDADILRLKGENLFDIAEQNGLVDYFDGKIPWQEAIHKTDFKNVSFCSRGSRRFGLGEFDGQKFGEFIEQARQEFDIIVVDTPAFSVGTEAMWIAGTSDIGVVVAGAHETGVDVFSDMVESLNSRGVTKLFGVLNRLTVQQTYHPGYYSDQGEGSSKPRLIKSA